MIYVPSAVLPRRRRRRLRGEQRFWSLLEGCGCVDK